MTRAKTGRVRNEGFPWAALIGAVLVGLTALVESQAEEETEKVESKKANETAAPPPAQPEAPMPVAPQLQSVFIDPATGLPYVFIPGVGSVWLDPAMAWARLHGQYQPVAPLPYYPYPQAYPADTPNVPTEMPQSPEPVGQPMPNPQEEASMAVAPVAPELLPRTVPMVPAPAYVPPPAPTMAPLTPLPPGVRPAPSVKPTNETQQDVLHWPAITHSQPIPTYSRMVHSSTTDVSSKIIAQRNLDAISRSLNRRGITRRRGQMRYARRIRAPAAASADEP